MCVCMYVYIVLFNNTYMYIFHLAVFQDQRIGVGITYINMNVGNIKETDQRSFDLTTPYRLRPFRSAPPTVAIWQTSHCDSSCLSAFAVRVKMMLGC